MLPRLHEEQLLKLIYGVKVSSKSSLANLCLVNKRFNDIFSQFLYKHITFTPSLLYTKRLWALINNRCLRLTQVLSFGPKDGFDVLPLHQIPGMKTSLGREVACLGRIITQCSNVHTLRYVGMI